MVIRLRKLQDQLRSSLFFVPMLFVLLAVVVGEGMLFLDSRVEGIPVRFTATVDSARSVLSVVASATLAFAGIAFSVSLLLISLSSSQYSPRVVHGLFRDPFNKRVMGIVIGTFTYSLVVLRAVRGPLEESGESVVPSISILVALVLGVFSVLAIIAFISHSAHSMDVSKILHDVTDDALAQVRVSWPEATSGNDEDSEMDLEPPSGDGFVVTFDRQGWIQQIDQEAMLGTLEPGAHMLLQTVPGRYAIPGTPLGTIWPAPADEEAACRKARKAVVVSEARTMQQDVSYGVRQLADVALKALSPGINDPTTAQDALFHLSAVMRELLVRTPPPRRREGGDDRVLVFSEAITPDELIGLAFDEVRIAAAGQPTVQIYLLEILRLLSSSLDESRHGEALAALRSEADLVLAIGERADLPDDDLNRVRAAHRSRFVDG